MNKTVALRILFAICVIFSIFLIYYTKVVHPNYEVFTNPEGPDVSDYFLIEQE